MGGAAAFGAGLCIRRPYSDSKLPERESMDTCPGFRCRRDASRRRVGFEDILLFFQDFFGCMIEREGLPAKSAGIMASIMQRWLRGEAPASAANTSSEPKKDPQMDITSKSDVCKAKNEELSTPKDSEAKGKGKGRKRVGETIDFESPGTRPKKKKSNTGGKV